MTSFGQSWTSPFTVPSRLIVIALPGSFHSAVAAVVNVAQAANELNLRSARPLLWQIHLCTPGAQPLALGRGITLKGLADLPAVRKSDLVIVPGAGQLSADQLLPWLQSPPVAHAREWLSDARRAGVTVAAGCSGTFVVATAGLLRGARATTTWWLAPLFRRLFPETTLDMRHTVVRDRRVWTAGAAFAHVDLMLQLVAHAGSERLASLCSRYLLHDPRELQLRYPLLDHLVSGDAFLARAERWALEHLRDVATAESLARAMGVSLRTLARRTQAGAGLTPLAFLQRIRQERAIHLLETTRQPVEQIAEQVGYGDATTLRRLLRRGVGQTPSAVRRRVQRDAHPADRR